MRSAGLPSRWLVFGAVALVALLLYLPTVRYGFVWDDRLLIVNDRFLDQANPIELFTKSFWTRPDSSPGADDMSYYRPLANLSLYVDRKLWGLQPAGYHLTNVVINTAIVVFTCLLLWEMFGSVWLAGLGGLLAGIHPAMNCVVAFISNRTYLLALFFLIAGSYALLRGRRDRARFLPALFGGSLLLSTLALEASVIYAVIAAAWLLVNRARYQQVRAWLAATAASAAAYLLLRLAIARVPFTTPGSVIRWAVTEPLRIVNAFGQQLQLLVFPFNQKVIYVPADPFTGFSAYTVLGLLFLGLPLYTAIRLARLSAQSADRAGRFGWYGYLWMVLFLLPFAHLVFLGPAGRMLYLVAPGALILAAAWYQSTGHKRLTARVAFGTVVLYASLCAVQTLRRNPVWRDELSLSEAMVREAPASAVGHASYGLALFAAGRRAEATEQFRIVVQLDPNSVAPRVGLAHALMDQGDLPGAITELGEAVRLRPESPEMRNDLAVLFARSGRLDSAIAEYGEALRLNPNSEVTLCNLGYAYLQNGDSLKAIQYLKAVLRLNPGLSAVRASLAAAYRAAGMPDSARLLGGQR